MKASKCITGSKPRDCSSEVAFWWAVRYTWNNHHKVVMLQQYTDCKRHNWSDRIQSSVAGVDRSHCDAT